MQGALWVGKSGAVLDGTPPVGGRVPVHRMPVLKTGSCQWNEEKCAWIMMVNNGQCG